MGDFNNNKRQQQSLMGRPLADDVYRRWLGEQVQIKRYDRDDGNAHVLDKFFAIDLKLTLPNGMILTGQEKFLSYRESRYNTVTVEYYNNSIAGDKGDWFHLACQFYFCAYLNENNTGFCKGVVIDWLHVVLGTHYSIINNLWRERANRFDGARASFRFININNIPAEYVLYNVLNEDG